MAWFLETASWTAAIFSQNVLLQEGLLSYGEGGVICYGGGDSTNEITPHCGVKRATMPLLGPFVPVVNDFVDSSVVMSISPAYAVPHCADPPGNAVVQTGLLKPAHTIPFYQAYVRHRSRYGEQKGESTASQVLEFQDK